MYHVVIGTRAQMIKMAPVMREMESQKIFYNLLFTGQHEATMSLLLDEFEIQRTPIHLYNGPEIDSIQKVIPWAYRVLRTAMKYIKSEQLPSRKERETFIVHGDTFSTLIGIALAKLTKGDVMHVESGLRSYNLMNPFPEEIIRRVAVRFSDTAFAPGNWAEGNLKNARGNVINTGENTIIDSVRFALGKRSSSAFPDADVLFSIHRFETLYSSSRIRCILQFIRDLSKRASIIFVLHPATEKRFREIGALDQLKTIPNVTVQPRMGYVDFISMASRMSLVVTDGGSNQEELSYVDTPVLLMRMATERREGLDGKAMLGKFDLEKMKRFSFNAIGESPAEPHLETKARPSETIVDFLRAETG